jgi:hypothetical protein
MKAHLNALQVDVVVADLEDDTDEVGERNVVAARRLGQRIVER